MSAPSRCFVCRKPLPEPRPYGVTCSKECHEKFVEKMELECGKHKKVVDVVTGKEYRVPTRIIIEKGVKYGELQKYPLWEVK